MAKTKFKYVRFTPDTGFTYDGLGRHCVAFQKKGGVLRCKKFKKSRRAPGSLIKRKMRSRRSRK